MNVGYQTNGITSPTWLGLCRFCSASVSSITRIVDTRFYILELWLLILEQLVLPAYIVMCTKGLTGAAAFHHYVHNQRVIGGHDAAPNTWRWQVKPTHVLLLIPHHAEWNHNQFSTVILFICSLFSFLLGLSSVRLIQWWFLLPLVWRHHHCEFLHHDCSSLHPQVGVNSWLAKITTH